MNSVVDKLLLIFNALDLLPTMLLLEHVSLVFISPGLLDNQLHGIDSLSHSCMHIYLDRVDMVMHVLAETYEL